MTNKTDMEIAVDAIKYCRAKLNTYNNLLKKYGLDFITLLT